MTVKLTRRSAVKNALVTAAALSMGSAMRATAGNAMSFEEYRSKDGLALAKLVRDGDISAAELLELAIGRANVVNPDINCIVEKLYDRARHEAGTSLPRGPFTGVPFLLKDLGMALKGTVTTQGSRFFSDWVAAHQ